MNKRFIPVMSVLMSISVLIFVVLQIKWLKEYYEALNHDFSNRVERALSSSVKRISEIEIDQYLNKQYTGFGKNIIHDYQNQPTVTMLQQVEDSVSKRIITYQKSIVESKDLPISAKGDSIKLTKLWNNEGIQKIKKNPNIPEPLTAELNIAISSGEYTLKEFAKLNASNLPIEKRVNRKVLDSVIYKSLKNNGIDTEFGYGVFDKQGHLTTIASPDFRENKTSFYTKTLFTDGKEQSLFVLGVCFPDKNFSLIRNYYPMLLGTFFALLIILGIYITSINYMMKQKKIADVKTDFINNMSHEFKTPLATISVAADSMVNDKIATNPEKVKYYARLIKQENFRMKKQVENVLNMSKLERNEVRLFLRETNVRQLICDISESFQLIVNERSGRLEKDFKAGQFMVKVDEFHISNVLINLLDNANKYSPESPQIKISTRNEGSWYVIEISDKGIGMEIHNKGKIFEKFFREEIGNIHNVKGQGLGLSYVKKIVELHKGKIEVETQKLKGSTFRVKLPMG